MIKTTSILLFSSIVVFSCSKEKAEEPTPTTPSATVLFATEVLPIFQQSCGTGGTCHGSSSAADGKVYETHAGASAVPDAITLGAIKHQSGFSPMPQNLSQLSSDKIAKIEAWINGGKKND